jgi:hypothetical protein
MWSNIWAVLGHCFYTSDWHGTTQIFFRLSYPNPFGTKHDRFGSGWSGPAQFPALTAGSSSPPYAAPARRGHSRCSPPGGPQAEGDHAEKPDAEQPDLAAVRADYLPAQNWTSYVSPPFELEKKRMLEIPKE